MDPAFRKLSDAFAAQLAGKGAELCEAHVENSRCAWSAREIIEHLVLTYRGTVSHIEKYIKRASVTSRKASWRETVVRVTVLNIGYLPRGQKAPEFAVPGRIGLPATDGNELAHLLSDELALLDEKLTLAERTFGQRTFAAHFRLGPLSAAQWRRFHCVHGRLHLAQLAELQKGFAARDLRNRE